MLLLNTSLNSIEVPHIPNKINKLYAHGIICDFCKYFNLSIYILCTSIYKYYDEFSQYVLLNTICIKPNDLPFHPSTNDKLYNTDFTKAYTKTF